MYSNSQTMTQVPVRHTTPPARFTPSRCGRQQPPRSQYRYFFKRVETIRCVRHPCVVSQREELIECKLSRTFLTYFQPGYQATVSFPSGRDSSRADSAWIRSARCLYKQSSACASLDGQTAWLSTSVAVAFTQDGCLSNDEHGRRHVADTCVRSTRTLYSSVAAEAKQSWLTPPPTVLSL